MSLLMECRGLGKTYISGETRLEVLKGLDLQIQKHEFVAVTGESGCGKSTLLHLLGCLDDPTQGVIRFQGQSFADLRDSEKDRMRNRDFGFVFQFHHLLPEFNALENVMLPGLMAGISERELRNRGEQLLTELNLAERIKHKPVKLSGGEQQRVAVARALINSPAMLFMDEPTGNLDPETSRELIALVRSQQQEKELTVVIVTHNREIAAQSDRHYELREGTLHSISMNRYYP